MSALTALLIYVIWTAALALSYALYRVPMLLTGARSADNWERNNASGQSDPPVLQRAKAAHLNCVENLPLFAAVVLAGLAVGHNAVVDSLAAYVLYARLVQSVIHLVGTNFLLIALRATAYILQIALIIIMALQLIGY